MEQYTAKNKNISHNREPSSVFDFKPLMIKCFRTNDLHVISESIVELENFNKKHPYVLILNAQFNTKQGHFQNAHGFLKRYLREFKKFDIFACEAMALWNYCVGRLTTAEKQYVSLLDFYPEDEYKKVELMFNIAVCKKELGFYDFALEILTSLLGISEGFKILPKIYIQTYHICLLRRNFTELKNYLKMFTFPCKNPFLNRIYAEMLFLEESYDALFDLVNESDFDTYLCYLAIRACLVYRGENTELENYFEDLLYYAEENYFFLTTYGNFLLKRGYLASAAQYYRLALEKNPNYEYAKSNLQFIESFGVIEDASNLYLDDKIKNYVPVDILPEVCNFGFFNVNVNLQGFACLLDQDFMNRAEIIDICIDLKQIKK